MTQQKPCICRALGHFLEVKCCACGARSRDRTGMASRPADFKSDASTSFAIRAMGAAASAQARHSATGLARKRSTAACRYDKAPDTGALSMQLGAGNETCTRRISRCFPNPFFAEVASEDLNCSLIFHPRQQDLPKNSTDLYRPARSTPAPHSALRRRRRSRTGLLPLTLCFRIPRR